MVDAIAEQLKNAMLGFLRQDDTPRNLLERLADLK